MRFSSLGRRACCPDPPAVEEETSHETRQPPLEPLRASRPSTTFPSPPVPWPASACSTGSAARWSAAASRCPRSCARSSGHQAGPCSIVGTDLHCAPGVAALLNGAAGHALDFDDTHSMMGGHPTVPVFPAALAQAQETGDQRAGGCLSLSSWALRSSRGSAPWSGRRPTSQGLALDLDDRGLRRCCRRLPPAGRQQRAVRPRPRPRRFAGERSQGELRHDDQAVPRRSRRRTRPALGAARDAGLHLEPRGGRRQAGLRRRGGLGPGRSQLAAVRGTGRPLPDRGHAVQVPRRLLPDPRRHRVGGLALRAAVGVQGPSRPEEVEKAIVSVHPGLLDVCGISEPKTGLEAKFSLVATTSLAMLGIDTTDTATFVDETLDKPGTRAHGRQG